jgi:hypothetical protein
VVSPAPPVHCPPGRSRVRPPSMPQILHITINQSRGATWQPTTGPRGTLTNQPKHATCQSSIGPRARAVLPCQFATSASVLSRHSATSAADVTHATCHPYSGDTCHLGIGPVRTPNRTRVKSAATCHLLELATCHLYGPATSAYRHATVSVRTDCTDCTVNNFFACLTYRTECDIFSIRSPFDKVNIPPESGRRDGRNGIGFVAFRALSFLSIFQALSGFWIRFRITPPHNKTFWSPKGY